MTEAQWCWQCNNYRSIRMTSITAVFFACLLTSQVLAWEALPNIPSGRRSQFLVLRDDGAYKFGYDTGDGNAAKQEGDPSNQVQGHYFYKNKAGQQIDLKYTSGVQGFQPEGLEKIQEFIKSSAPAGPSSSYLPAAQTYSSSNDDNSGDYKPDDSGAYNPDDSGAYNPEDSGANNPEDSGAYKPDETGGYQPDNSGDYKGDQEPTGDASYNFDVDTASYKRTETSDAGGNIQGKYSFTNKAGTHDLEYVAGAGTGFIARSGSLSKPNGLGGGGGQGEYQRSGGYQEPSSSGGYGYSNPSSDAAPKGPINPDGSYSFGFNSGDQSREESGDVGGNVRGRFSYRNSAGNHDLSYKAGSETGFLVTGGSLAKPNGLPNGAGPSAGPSSYSGPTSYSAPAAPAPFGSTSSSSGDGSYSFGFSTGDQDRQEDSDATGNVRGRYSYRNSAGSHDLSYVAGASTGFQPTGGSLANPNGLRGGSLPLDRSASPGYSYNPPSARGDYSDSNSQDDQADTGDSSYNFSFDTPEYTRQEASDARGNVRGSFRYTNKAGSNDLSFVAGSATGFKPTGGSLSVPNGLEGKNIPGAAPNTYIPPSGSDSVEIAAARSGDYSPSNDEASSGDASYNFSFDTDEYKRQESSDGSGNVRGSFSYKNSVGDHDLSFVAGSGTGFKPTGGSLTPAPGVSEAQLRAGFRGGSSAFRSASTSSRINSFISGGGSSYEAPAAHSTLPETKSSYRLGNVNVHTYLPPSNVKHKFGYIFDTQ